MRSKYAPNVLSVDDTRSSTPVAFESTLQQQFSPVWVYTFRADGRQNVNHQHELPSYGIHLDVYIVYGIYALTRKPTTTEKGLPRAEYFSSLKGL